VKSWILAAWLLTIAFTAYSETATLSVSVGGIRSETGLLNYLVFDDPRAFPREREEAVLGGRVEIDAGTVQFEVSQLPYGTYAISVLHDENRNNVMETGVFGVPREGYGFSNDAPLRFGPPRFEDAAIDVDQPQMTIRIEMRYWR
jgi:uncharacterized protein (DUF2141 family)